jgi:hypothetical protein
MSTSLSPGEWIACWAEWAVSGALVPVDGTTVIVDNAGRIAVGLVQDNNVADLNAGKLFSVVSIVDEDTLDVLPPYEVISVRDGGIRNVHLAGGPAFPRFKRWDPAVSPAGAWADDEIKVGDLPPLPPASLQPGIAPRQFLVTGPLPYNFERRAFTTADLPTGAFRQALICPAVAPFDPAFRGLDGEDIVGGTIALARLGTGTSRQALICPQVGPAAPEYRSLVWDDVTGNLPPSRFGNQSGRHALMAPANNTSGAPTFRSIGLDDIPAITNAKLAGAGPYKRYTGSSWTDGGVDAGEVTSGTLPLARLLPSSATNRSVLIYATGSPATLSWRTLGGEDIVGPNSEDANNYINSYRIRIGAGLVRTGPLASTVIEATAVPSGSTGAVQLSDGSSAFTSDAAFVFASNQVRHARDGTAAAPAFRLSTTDQTGLYATTTAVVAANGPECSVTTKGVVTARFRRVTNGGQALVRQALLDAGSTAYTAAAPAVHMNANSGMYAVGTGDATIVKLTANNADVLNVQSGAGGAADILPDGAGLGRFEVTPTATNMNTSTSRFGNPAVVTGPTVISHSLFALQSASFVQADCTGIASISGTTVTFFFLKMGPVVFIHIPFWAGTFNTNSTKSINAGKLPAGFYNPASTNTARSFFSGTGVTGNRDLWADVRGTGAIDFYRTSDTGQRIALSTTSGHAFNFYAMNWAFIVPP